MPKQPIAVELEAINREGETQVVRDSGLTVQDYSVYLRAAKPTDWPWPPGSLTTTPLVQPMNWQNG